MNARGRTAKVLTSRYAGSGTGLRRVPDELIVEEPLEIRLDGVLVTTTMRTPGNDFELAAGFCFTEGLLAGATVQACRYCATASAVETAFNVVSVDTAGRAPVPTPRLGATTSSCGLCGSTSIDQLAERLRPLAEPQGFTLDVLASVPDRVRVAQPLFEATGAVHAAAAFDRTGEVVHVREDVGRHNAVDKVVGRLLLDGVLPASRFGLYVSGRASFEIVQKAWAAGFPAVVAVSAPSSLAVETAHRANLLLAGFARDGRLNLYSGADRAA
ncbi:formate dehydrogenase accessory sulfurtransferase FdhD [Rhabdothermincola sp.]|uniref:formate dehydrogenase accessory sulfurtransferase FdhD n=1 Tax=Rhabdothermincola sp. TaxID=2820405 RepID=UPI002FDF8A98